MGLTGWTELWREDQDLGVGGGEVVRMTPTGCWLEHLDEDKEQMKSCLREKFSFESVSGPHIPTDLQLINYVYTHKDRRDLLY